MFDDQFTRLDKTVFTEDLEENSAGTLEQVCGFAESFGRKNLYQVEEVTMQSTM